MTKIPAWVYIAVGLFISITSFFRYQKFFLFFYAGLIFIFVGLIKLFSKWMKSKTGGDVPHHKMHSDGKASTQIKYCNQCGNPMKLSDKFCMRCGTKV